MEDKINNIPASSDERNFRPLTLDDFIGQSDLKKTLRLTLDSARMRSTTLEHVAFYGGPGLGKTTLAGIIASETKYESPDPRGIMLLNGEAEVGASESCAIVISLKCSPLNKTLYEPGGIAK